MKQTKILETYKSYIATPMAFYGTALPAASIEATLNYPLWQLLMDNPALGLTMTVMLAVLYMIIVKILGALIAKPDYKAAAMASACIAGIIALAFFGQREVALDGDNNPLDILFDEGVGTSETSDSMRHYIATGLLSALTCISAVISYLYHKEKFRLQPLKIGAAASEQLQGLNHEIQTTANALTRAQAQPEIAGQNRVHEKLTQLEKEINERQQVIDAAMAEKRWILENINTAQEAFALAIHTVYQKSKNI